MSLCRYCRKPVIKEDAVETFGYFGNTPDHCHLACKPEGIKQEAFDCQMIDADCNDCRHFKRDRIAGKVRSLTMRTDGTQYEVIHQPNVVYGHCLKFDKPTQAFPNKWTGRECFEHRRSSTR